MPGVLVGFVWYESSHKIRSCENSAYPQVHTLSGPFYIVSVRIVCIISPMYLDSRDVKSSVYSFKVNINISELH